MGWFGVSQDQGTGVICGSKIVGRRLQNKTRYVILKHCGWGIGWGIGYVSNQYGITREGECF